MGILDGKVALITGASRGIGAAIAEEFAREGASVVLTARSSTEQPGKLPGTLEETASAVEAAGGKALSITADLTNGEDRERIVREALQHFGKIDILVNNAAVTFFQPGAELKLSRSQLMFDIQVQAPMHLSQLVFPGMRERGQGWILNITSGESRHPEIPPSRFNAKGTTTVYGMVKAGLERLTTGFAAEGFNDGITVNALRPTKLVATPGPVFHGVLKADDPNAESPDVMARAAVVLCSAAPDRVSGRILESEEVLADWTPRTQHQAGSRA
ncbi:SDR family NAD(P)-dependent oxidoreductase [Arthrobacter sp. MMS18-M83]|uniref:SDR family NAD(P)-dependent oxidoreductase n=1 Tax=Arthrobacter sp. MMS18-M83 TaxID=2996261 RepID=UPI00227B024E|nr:SDR family NAD(P)-dependent oxidoreductase [Arthrobacter sp. MMS18-M83]WAH96319.1 SDR family NAD(P)-dependent oxidoreductase [Arthrobacter sp. MMS18-M83]